MTFETLFLGSTYLMVLIGILSLALAEGSLFYITLATFASPASLWFVHLRRSFVLPKGGAIALSVGALFFILLDRIFLFSPLVNCLAHFLILIQIVKLFQEKTQRDYLQIYLISFVHLLVASALSFHISFAFSFLLYLVVGMWTLMLFHFRGELEARGEIGRERNFLDLRLFLTMLFLLFSVLGGTVFLFVSFPRFGLPTIRLGEPLGGSVSGFSEEVALGDIGLIKENSRRVMRVELPDGERDLHPLWRGIAFDHYDGLRWSVSRDRKRHYMVDLEGNVNLLHRGTERATQGRKVRQRFSIEGLNTRILFALYVPTAVTDGPDRIFWDDNDTISVRSPYVHGIRYTVTSFVPRVPRDLSHLRFHDFPKGYPFLQLPENLPDRVRRLARNVVFGIENPYEVAKEIERFLQDNYGYTLDAGVTPGLDPIEDFLFVRKEGHCEYFATAMVLLLRVAGIPARLVNGFSGGEWNEGGGYFLVRQNDAHSWVEAEFPEIGWLSFDPTPAAPGSEGRSRGWWKRLSRYLDMLHFAWQSNVIDYDAKRQEKTWLASSRFLRSFFASLSETSKRLYGSEETQVQEARRPRGGGRGMNALLGFLLLGVSLLLLRYRHALRLRLLRRFSPHRLYGRVAFYHEFLALLARHGLRRPPCATPREFVDLLGAWGFHAPEVEEITDRYYAVRFGASSLSPQEEAHLAELLAALRSRLQAWRKAHGRPWYAWGRRIVGGEG
ncbi:MAG: DUF3488 domain-containing protein [Deltaproteobacteria bacterium]|nr:MAG: DUF3488 domain-containing protein [Deltaproteobacteria bacterium]